MVMLLEFLMVLIIIAAATFIHELGHAVAVLTANKKAKAEIYMGTINKEKKLELCFGRLTCYLAIALTGYCRVANSGQIPPLTIKQKLFFSTGGPIASFLGFISFYYLSQQISGVPGVIINRVAVVSLFIFIFTAIPYRYPAFMRNLNGHQTDGLYIWNELKELRRTA